MSEENIIKQKCRICGNEFPATSEYFHKCKTGKYGLRARCKKCISPINKIYNERNGERRKQNWKEWISNNKERREQYWQEYACKNKDKLETYRNNNKERHNKIDKEYREKNKETIAAKRKAYWRTEKYRKANIQKVQKRRAQKMSLPNDFKVEDWEKCKNYFHNRCAYCGCEGDIEQDHFIPLSRGGGYTANNIIPACKKCNSSKQANLFEEWYIKQQFYSIDRELKIKNYLKEMSPLGDILLLQTDPEQAMAMLQQVMQGQPTI